MEQQLPASAGERQIAQFVEEHEFAPRQMLGELSGAALVNLHLESVYKIGRVVEANASTGADATARDSDTQMRFSRARPTDEHDIALVGEESPGGEIADQRLVDRGVGELEVRDLLGERQRSEEHTYELQSLMRNSYAVV